MDHFLEPTKLAPILQDLQKKGKKIVFTNGVFDLLHLGHVTYLREARAQGDLLVVGLNSDASVKRIKGPLKPLLPLAERAEMLLALDCVDYATFFEEADPFNIIKILQPDVLVKGGDWALDKIIGADLVKARGGKVMNIPVVEGRSTTNIIETVVERYGKKMRIYHGGTENTEKIKKESGVKIGKSFVFLRVLRASVVNRGLSYAV